MKKLGIAIISFALSLTACGDADTDRQGVERTDGEVAEDSMDRDDNAQAYVDRCDTAYSIISDSDESLGCEAAFASCSNFEQFYITVHMECEAGIDPVEGLPCDIDHDYLVDAEGVSMLSDGCQEGYALLEPQNNNLGDAIWIAVSGGNSDTTELAQIASGSAYCGSPTDLAADGAHPYAPGEDGVGPGLPCPGNAARDHVAARVSGYNADEYNSQSDAACRRHDHGTRFQAVSVAGFNLPLVKLGCNIDANLVSDGGTNGSVAATTINLIFGTNWNSVSNASGCLDTKRECTGYSWRWKSCGSWCSYPSRDCNGYRTVEYTDWGWNRFDSINYNYKYFDARHDTCTDGIAGSSGKYGDFDNSYPQ